MKRLLYRFFAFAGGLLVVSTFFQFSTEGNFLKSESTLHRRIADPPFLDSGASWADSVYESLSMSERIAQFIMVAAYSQNGRENTADVLENVRKFNIGGIIFFQGNPFKQAQITNRLQQQAKTPLMIAMDAEWGLAMRLDSTLCYPRQMMLGAIRDERLIYEMGQHIAEQFALMGMHINFAPVVDVNNNPDNPVINSRSFGEDRVNVATKGLLYMQGMQDNHVLAVAKHFPGHGDTDTDSHLDLPVIPHERSRLDSIELFPFKELINGGIGGIMSAHLHVPALDSTSNIPSSLTPLIVDSLLRSDFNFRGLVFTDAMNMGGVTRHFHKGVASVMAFMAGNDIILMPDDVNRTIHLIRQEMKRGRISEQEIEKRCKKILKAKYWMGLDSIAEVKTDSLTFKLNNPRYQLLNRKLTESSLTILRNEQELIPFERLDTLRIATLAIGERNINEFQKTIDLYLGSDHFTIAKNEPIERFYSLFDTLKHYNLVIAGIHNTDMRAHRNFGITSQTITFLDSLADLTPLVVDVFANPYALSSFSNLRSLKSLIVSYEDNDITQSLSAQLLFGGIGAQGRLPVTVSNSFKSGDGINTRGNLRLKYSIPAEANMDENSLQKIDSLVWSAIYQKAMPGCQVLVARDGTVVFHKAYGHFTYRKRHRVKLTDLYDLASVTKISATLPVLMHLYEQGKIDISYRIAQYVPFLDTTNKRDIIIRDILLHQAGLKSWIPFYKSTIEPLYPGQNISSNRYSYAYPIRLGKYYYANKHLKYKDGYYSSLQSDEFPVQVAENLFMNRCLIDTIYAKIAVSEPNGSDDYCYSDLGYYMLQLALDSLTGSTLDHYTEDFLYGKIGAGTMGYLPLKRFNKDRIAPTENDLVFRKQIIHGYVHDPGAAMLGGVAGHAGLFSNANDLAKLMQVYLNGGEYAGDRFFKQKTIDKFTSCPECNNGNRRGLGFDKPQTDTTKPGPVIRDISPESFGHSGFTGILVWSDPDEKITYIFLSNRVFPDAADNMLVRLNTRTEIQQVIYDAITDRKKIRVRP